MKSILYRLFMLILAGSLLVLPLAAFAETEAVYALQGDVRVYAENGLCGLEDAAGNRMTDAVYEEICPFEEDWAVCRRDGLYGILNKSGNEIIPAQYDSVGLETGFGCAVGVMYDSLVTVLDLSDGSVIRSGSFSCGATDKYFGFAESDGYGFFSDPPYHTELVDHDFNTVLEVDAELNHYDEEHGVFIARFNDGKYGLLSEDGSVLLSGCDEIRREGDVYSYSRSVMNPFRAFCESIGYTRDHVWKSLMRRGADPDEAETATCVLNDFPVAGIYRFGEPVFEVTGVYVSEPDPEGLRLVQYSGYRALPDSDYNRYGYMNDKGEYVIEPVYSYAFPFTDGAAVVRIARTIYDDEGLPTDFGEWALIDPQGERVGDTRWYYYSPMYDNVIFSRSVFPVKTDESGFRLMNRKGEIISDEVFKEAGTTAGDYLIAEDADGCTCFIDRDGAIVKRLSLGEWSYSSSDGLILYPSEGTMHVIDLNDGSEFEVIDTPYTELELYDGTGRTEDGIKVYINENYEAVAPVFESEDDWFW